MSNQSLETRVLDRLLRATQSGLLPAAEQAEAEKLLVRLQQPVRLALMGMPSSGKSSLLNLLAGADVLPEGVRLPTLQLRYGAQSRTICTLPDGTKQTIVDASAHDIAALSPVFVTKRSRALKIQEKQPKPAEAMFCISLSRLTEFFAMKFNPIIRCSRSLVRSPE